jgi:hypothetical protein
VVDSIGKCTDAESPVTDVKLFCNRHPAFWGLEAIDFIEENEKGRVCGATQMSKCKFYFSTDRYLNRFLFAPSLLWL